MERRCTYKNALLTLVLLILLYYDALFTVVLLTKRFRSVTECKEGRQASVAEGEIVNTPSYSPDARYKNALFTILFRFVYFRINHIIILLFLLICAS